MKFTIALIIISFASMAQTQPAFDPAKMVEADSLYTSLDPGIYFMTLGEYSVPRLRVSLYYWWGSTEIFLEEIWYDDVEGNPHVSAGYQLSMDDVSEQLQMEYVWALEFSGWVDSVTFEMEANRGEFDLLVEYAGCGIFLIERTI